MEKSVIRDEKLKAEIVWALKAIMSHYSYKSCEGTSKLFQAMFPDNRIASQFSCGGKKQTWSVLGLLLTSNSCWRTLRKKKRLMYFCLMRALIVCVSQRKWIFTFAHGIMTNTRLEKSLLYLSDYGSWHSRPNSFSFSLRPRLNSSQKGSSGRMLLPLCLGDLNINTIKINMLVSSLITFPHRFRKYM